MNRIISSMYQNQNKYFYEDIIKDLNEIPCAGCPGELIVYGENAQAVFAYENPKQVILAAAEYGDGRIFVCSHDYFGNNLLKDDVNGLEKSFIDNVKLWLSKGENIDFSSILDIYRSNETTDFNSFKMIKWIYRENLKHDIIEKLGRYVESGGSLFCAITTWAFMANKQSNEIDMHNFLTQHAGILLLGSSFGCPTRLPVSKNQAKYSNFSRAIKKVSQDPTKLPKYCRALESVNILCRECLVDVDTIRQLKNSLVNESLKNNWCIVPSEKKPVKKQEEKTVVNVLGKCLMQLDEKATNIEEFPGDYAELPDLLKNVEIEVSAGFNERLSTGYYLPAAIDMKVRVVEGDHKNWKVRVGAHSDDLTDRDRYTRWPIVTIIKNLEENEISLRSPFGGLVYLER